MNVIEHSVLVYYCPQHGYWVGYFDPGGPPVVCRPGCQERKIHISTLEPAAFIEALLNHGESGKRVLIREISVQKSAAENNSFRA